jgi:hypothetical protein
MISYFCSFKVFKNFTNPNIGLLPVPPQESTHKKLHTSSSREGYKQKKQKIYY